MTVLYSTVQKNSQKIANLPNQIPTETSIFLKFFDNYSLLKKTAEEGGGEPKEDAQLEQRRGQPCRGRQPQQAGEDCAKNAEEK